MSVTPLPPRSNLSRPAEGLRAARQPSSGGVRPAADGFERAKQTAFQTLRRGSTGPLVRAMQLKLVARGLLSRADFSNGPGVFGPRTEQAVRKLQRLSTLPETGVFDSKTNVALLTRRTPERKPIAEATTDVFEKPASISSSNPPSASATVTDEDDPTTGPLTPLKTG